MIELEAVRHEAGDGSVILDVPALSIAEGERVGIVGASGSGKSTLGCHLCGVHGRALLGRTSGRVRLGGQDCSDRDLPGFAGVVMQNPEPQLFGETVEEEVALSLENLGRAPEEIRAGTDRMLDRLGLASRRKARVASLSLGLKQRLSIAAMLAVEPRALFLDEPTNYLDGPMADDLFRLLARLPGTVIVVEHDLDRLFGWAERILVVEGGRVVVDAPPGPALRERLRVRIPSPEGSRPIGETLLTATNLGHFYVKGAPTLREASLEIRRGEVIALLGVNGSGKTTLLKLLKGLLKPSAGAVRSASGEPLMDCVGLVFQNPDEQIFAHTAEEECAYLLRNRNTEREERSARAAAALEEVGLGDKRFRLPMTFSYGEKRRLALASILIGDPDVLCLDEPTVALDEAGLRNLAELLIRRAEVGKAVVFATHDARFAAAVASRRVVLEDGRIVADEPASPRAA